MNRQFAERLKLLKDFWGNSSGGAYFPPEEEYAHRKEHKKTQETGLVMNAAPYFYIVLPVTPNTLFSEVIKILQ